MSLRACLRCLAALLLSAACAVGAAAPQARDGVLDLSGWRFDAHGMAPLDGRWQFVPSRLVGPDEPWPAQSVGINVPGPWNGVLGSGRGMGTYRLVVKCGSPDALALAVPFQHAAAVVYVNGRLASRQGRPGMPQAGHEPEISHRFVPLEGTNCPLDIRVQVSNGEFFRGGLVRSVLLGDAQQIAKRRDLTQVRGLAFLGAMAVMGLFSLFFYAARPRTRVGLYFGLFCLTTAFALGLSGERVLLPVLAGLPFDWHARLLFWNFCAGLLVYPLLVLELLPRHANRRIGHALAAASAAGAVLCLVTPPRIFVPLAPLLQALAWAVAVYVLWAVVRAWLARERGALPLLAGVVAMLAAALHDLAFYQHLLAFSALPYGLAAAVLTPAVLLAQRMARALSVEELRALEQRGRTDLLVRSTQAGLLDWDGIADSATYSARFCEMLRYGPGQGPPPLSELLHPDEFAHVNESFLRQLRDRSVRGGIRTNEPMDFRLRCADDDYIWVHAEGISVCDSTGRVLRFIGSFIDITGRMRQSQELARQVEIAQAAQEALAHEQERLRQSRDEVAGQASQLEAANAALREAVRLREEVERIARHDIKTPLNSIIAVPRLLREERQLGPEADELLGVVERAGYRILSMVNLSLDLYKMERGDYVFRPDAVDLDDVLDKIGADLRTHAASKYVQLEFDTTGAPYAWAEELLCYSLLANLLKNAIEASPEDAQVTASCEAAAGHVLLRIHNAGAVPPELRETFFEKYATAGKASGTGLGTYSAQLMARVQDGDITMESSLEEGTTLTVRLRAAPQGAVPATLRHAAERRTAMSQRIAAMPPWRVLLVDDDEYNLLIVRRFLPSPPFEVETAVNGKLALAAATERWPDVVVMDLDMPVMGGLEAVGHLREIERARGGRRCAILALSSHEDEDTRRRALASGFDRYLAKPVTREVVQEALLELHAQGRAGVAASAGGPPPKLEGIDVPVQADADLRELMPAFLDSRRELVGQLLAAVVDGRREEVRRLAHQLAGSFGLYGFAWAGGHSRWLERESRGAELAEMEEVALQLRRHLDTVQVRYST